MKTAGSSAYGIKHDAWSPALTSAHPQMALLRDFSVGRRDLNPQNSTLFLRFKSDARLELTQNPSFVDGH